MGRDTTSAEGSELSHVDNGAHGWRNGVVHDQRVVLAQATLLVGPKGHHMPRVHARRGGDGDTRTELDAARVGGAGQHIQRCKAAEPGRYGTYGTNHTNQNPHTPQRQHNVKHNPHALICTLPASTHHAAGDMRVWARKRQKKPKTTAPPITPHVQ